MKIRYYFLLITFFILGYLYSCKKDFARHADVITSSVDVVTAIAHGRLTDLGSKPISEHGFVWDSISTPGITGKRLQLGGLQNTGDFQGKLPDLLPNKTYYFKAFIIYNQEAFYGDMVSFTTPDLPTLTTLAISEISQSTAKSGGNITNDGGAPVTAYGVCWSISASPDLTGFHTIDGTGTGTYTSNLTSLAANTIYHVRAYATNNYGTRYGNEVVFNTGQSSTSPIVNTTDVTGITQTAAQSGGEVVSDGGSPVTQRGVCWNSTPYPTISNNHSSDGSGTGIFTSSITALTAGTTYYLRAFAINSVGTSYGSEKSFMTLSAPGLPSVTTAAVTNITATTATLGGVVLNDGGATVTQRGVCWSTNPNPTTTDSHTSDGSGVGSFTSSVTGLTSTITYHIRAYATNSTGTAYGNEISFTAGQNLTSPTVTTTEVVNILQTTATCGGNVTSDGGATVTLRGVCWSTSTNPTTSDYKTQDGSGTGGYLSSMTGLTASITYHVRAYAINSVGTSYGNEKVFTTLAEPTPPSVSTAPVTNITNTSAISGGTVTSDGGASVTARGVCWSTSASPNITNPHTTDGTGIGGFMSNVTGLNGNTTYYLRAYATNIQGTTYGNQVTFTTLQNPILATLTTTDATAITQTTAISGGNVTSDGGSAVTSRGVCWSTSANPTTSNNHTTDGSGTGVFVSSLTGLSPNTVYYVRAYAVNNVGTAYGNQISFTTLSGIVPPTVTTTAITNITQTTATSGGNVTADGGATVIARGVCWSTTSSPTISNPHTTDGSGTGTFVSNLTGLTANTLYYVRAYATNSSGTAYGNEVTFTTLPNLPTVTTTAATNITSTSATTGGNVTGNGGSSVTARGVCYNTSSSPTLANSHTTDGSGNGTFISNLTGLIPNTLYYVRAYATNSNGTSYGNEITFTTLPTLPSVTTAGVTNITTTTATSGGNVTSDGGSAVSARGVCWSTSTGPTLTDSHTIDGSGTGTFTSNISGLNSNTLYYVRAYATNSVGTVFGNEITFTTLWDCGNQITYSNQTYNTVLIGTQCWFKENLNVGTRINATDGQSNNGIKEKYCYDDQEYNCNTYGGLYQWAEAVQYLNGAGNNNSWNPVPTGNVQGLCPTGWHIPKIEEWDNLISFLGGQDVAGGKLKETGTNHWQSPNTGATNESGFTGLGSGHATQFAQFFNMLQMTWYWPATEYSSSAALCRYLRYNGGDSYQNNHPKATANSIRCVKD